MKRQRMIRTVVSVGGTLAVGAFAYARSHAFFLELAHPWTLDEKFGAWAPYWPLLIAAAAALVVGPALYGVTFLASRLLETHSRGSSPARSWVRWGLLVGALGILLVAVASGWRLLERTQGEQSAQAHWNQVSAPVHTLWAGTCDGFMEPIRSDVFARQLPAMAQKMKDAASRFGAISHPEPLRSEAETVEHHARELAKVYTTIGEAAARTNEFCRTQPRLCSHAETEFLRLLEQNAMVTYRLRASGLQTALTVFVGSLARTLPPIACSF